ncbi:MAG: ATPase, T2SS/T4P/T4SS family [Microthrixaceae bacterium]
MSPSTEASGGPTSVVESVGDASEIDMRVRRRFQSEPAPAAVRTRAGRGIVVSTIFGADPMVARDTEEVASGEGPQVDDPVRAIEALLCQEAPLLSDSDRRQRAEALAVEMVGLGAIQSLLDDPLVTDVLVNGPGTVWVEREGRLQRSEISVDHRSILRSIERLVGPLGLSADRSNPIVDARLPDGARVTVILPPLAPDGPLLALRRHRAEPLSLEAFGGKTVVAVLKTVVRRALNVIVFGPTGAGKTSLLNALARELPPSERVVTVEDTAELQLPGDHTVRLESRPGRADGAGRTDIRDLVRASLRLRPDRIVVGEVRGPEAVDMIWAMSTGHRGCFSTCHAAGPADALRRIETMVLLGADQLSADAVRAQVNSAIDILIGLRRNVDGSRSVESVHCLSSDGELTRLWALPGS